MTVPTMPEEQTLDRPAPALRRTIAELRARLSEVEETLCAIRSGEVDAITVTTPAGERVYSLTGAEQSYRRMIEAMTEGAVTVTPDGMVVYCNQRFADMVATDLHAVMGSNFLAYFVGKDRTQVTAALREHGASRTRAQMLRADGASLAVNVAMHVQADGGIRSTIIVVSDLTETVAAQQVTAQAEQELADYRHRLEELVAERTADLAESNQALNSSNHELETFAYSVSHDLQAPLRAIVGFSQMLKEDYDDKLDAEAQRLIHVICAGAERMGRLIADILAFSRFAGREVAGTDIDMTDLVRATLNDLAPAMGGRNVEVKLAPLPHVHGDWEMIQRVWLNLLDNAIKFTGRQENTLIEVGSYPEVRNTVYFVKDNGAGFDMAYVGKLFGVFQRLHAADDFPGTGAGLAIVKRIVGRHGGKVWAEAKVGKGATFYFALPTSDPASG